MENIKELVDRINSKDNKEAYKCLKLLQSESEQSNKVYRFFERFVEMVDSTSSYIRTRGLLLICANAKWDLEDKIESNIDKILEHIY